MNTGEDNIGRKISSRTMSKRTVTRVGGHTSRHPVSVDINGILTNAMKAVNDAQRAVAQIQSIARIDTAPPYIPPDTPTIDPRTGLPKSQIPAGAVGGSVSIRRSVVHTDKSTMRMMDGTLINIVNSQNVQIGHNNKMFIFNRPPQDSSSDSEPEVEDLEEDFHQRRLADEETAEILRDSHRQVSDAELQRLSRHIGGTWRRLIRLLGIDDSEVDYIFHTHQSDGLEEVIYQLLKKWKQENDNPTVGKLIGALERANMTRLLHHLKP